MKREYPMSIKPATNGSALATVTDDGTEAEKTDMNKVNYFLSRPGLLLEQLPESRRAELSEHVGRRALNRGLANPRLNGRR